MKAIDERQATVRQTFLRVLRASVGAAVFGLVAATASGQSTAAEAPAANNGTDPSKMITAAQVQYQYLGLVNGFNSGTFKVSYTQPLGAKKSSSLRLRLPVASVDVLGRSGFGLGDVSIMLTRVFGLTPSHAYVAQGEVFFDTASRPELGAGKTVAKGTLIYAKFLKGGAIFAPAIVQGVSIAGDEARARVNTTTIDLYYVPKMANPKLFVTIDPAVVVDWENDLEFVSLAVTAGRMLGPAFGGMSQAFVKPSVFGGRDRGANWGIEAGVKVLGF